MFVSECLSVNNQGRLTIGGKDTLELAAEFATPLYVMDEGQIRANYRQYMASLQAYYGGKGIAAFACKAFCCKAMCVLAAEEGMALDIASAGELYTALEAGFPPDRMLLHGNNKPAAELAFAIKNDVGRIVADNLQEIELIDQIAASLGKRQAVQLRIKPGVDPHTHEFVRTGQVDSKFGFTLHSGEALEAARVAARMEHTVLMGVHCHIGSQIFDVQPFVLAAEIMMGFIADIRDSLGVTINELNLGGGLGISYTQQDNPTGYDRYMQEVCGAIQKVCAERAMDTPYIYLEPGRSIVGPAGITLYTVGALKEIPGIRTYLTVDGGMTDNPRYALYGSRYTMVIANRAAASADKVYTVAGRCCESGDLLGKDVPLQEAKAGDILAVLATGAYNYSMASNYNRLPKPPVVFVQDGKARLVVKRQTMEDIIQNDL
jgi:diaminopimelate decarboxylase